MVQTRLDKRQRRLIARRRTRLVLRAAGVLVAVVALAAASFGLPWSRRWQRLPEPSRAPLPRVSSELTDEELQRAADGLLAAVNPDLPENGYFNDYAREKVRWMNRQHAAGRLTIAMVFETAGPVMPPDVLMAATKLNGRPTVLIARERFASFLREGGRSESPFTPGQKNDFLVALTHEVVHLQNPSADASTPEARAREEGRVWREVNLNLVRPFRALQQPIHGLFLRVDDAFRNCRDRLPCPELSALVRLVR